MWLACVPNVAVPCWQAQHLYPHIASRDRREQVFAYWLRSLNERNFHFSQWAAADFKEPARRGCVLRLSPAMLTHMSQDGHGVYLDTTLSPDQRICGSVGASNSCMRVLQTAPRALYASVATR